MSASVCCYIGMGSNLGNSIAIVQEAILLLGGMPSCSLEAQSSLYRTAPIDSSGSDYINAVICLNTTLSPEILLHQMQGLEHRFGRVRPYQNAPRTLDLDMLLYGDWQFHHENLQIPHPRMTQRAFVLAPLLEINPTLFIPGAGAASLYLSQTTHQRCERLKV